ncbi:MAG: BON domain-containing protein [Acidobacteriota bacterium]
MKQRARWALAGALLIAPALVRASVRTPAPADDLEKQVRHELVMLPYYNLFDNFSFKVDGRDVTLYGQVVRPVLKEDAERVVKRIPGVESVTNRIEVLPLSPMDDRIRLAAARAIYGYPALSRYAYGPLSPIHIIVRNGNLTLEGVVANQTDKNIAGLRANGVFGVFSVTNNLQVERG